jgi:hypothetical protein
MARSVVMILLMAAFLMILSSCGNMENTGGLTIPNSDGTAPGVSLTVDPEFGQSVAVSSGGVDASTSILRRVGKIALAATAVDQESGIQRIEVRITYDETTCDAGDVCKHTGSNRQPLESDSGEKSPGDQTAASSIFLDSLQAEDELGTGSAPPGGTRTVTLELWAVARNYLGGEAKTPVAAVRFHEEG